jgi:hypothetical protein
MQRDGSGTSAVREAIVAERVNDEVWTAGDLHERLERRFYPDLSIELQDGKVVNVKVN